MNKESWNGQINRKKFRWNKNIVWKTLLIFKNIYSEKWKKLLQKALSRVFIEFLLKTVKMTADEEGTNMTTTPPLSQQLKLRNSPELVPTRFLSYGKMKTRKLAQEESCLKQCWKFEWFEQKHSWKRKIEKNRLFKLNKSRWTNWNF